MTVPGRVSVGICTLNRSELALRAIRSVLGQTYRDLEVIVSDDASTDNTAQRVPEIQDPRLKFFRQDTRLGIVQNPNFALRQASGEFWLFMGDDDMLLPTAIEKLVKPFLEKKSGSPTVGAAWCPCLVADSKSNEFWTTEGGPTRESVASLLSQLFAGNRGPRCSSILLRREDAVSVGGYQKKYGDLSDIGNWGRAALLSEVAVCINEPLVQYTMHQSNTTGRASVEQWQRWAELVHEDMLTMVRERGDANSEKELTAARNNFISGITLTILSSRVGKPGWIWNALTQSLRTPGAIFTPYMFRRLRKDGKKVLRLVRSAREHRTGAGPIEMKR